MNNEIKELALKSEYTFEDLQKIMKILRSPGGCPWDREQNHKSIRKNFIEETYEVAEAIDAGNSSLLCEELGDVMLQVVFHTQMETESGSFTMGDVLNGICRKLINRHPHIFADTVADTSEKVLENWDAIKKVEKGQKNVRDVLNAVPKTLPALMKAQKLIKKAEKNGLKLCFDNPVYSSLSEEEYGNMLMEICAGANKKGIDLEEILDKNCSNIIKNC